MKKRECLDAIKSQPTFPILRHAGGNGLLIMQEALYRPQFCGEDYSAAQNELFFAWTHLNLFFKKFLIYRSFRRR